MSRFERVMCPFLGCYYAVVLKGDTRAERRDAGYQITQHRRLKHRGARSLVDTERQEKWHYEHPTRDTGR